MDAYELECMRDQLYNMDLENYEKMLLIDAEIAAQFSQGLGDAVNAIETILDQLPENN